jgi:hypothetical protein
MARILPGISSFYVGGPSSLDWSGGPVPGMGCLVPLSFAAGGN